MKTSGYEPLEFAVELKNYQCFTDEKPARIRLRPGFTALIGPNNAGKSAVFRALFDLRGTMEALAGPNGLSSVLSHSGAFKMRHHLLPESTDRSFTRLNDRPLSFAIRLEGANQEERAPVADEIIVEFPRDAHASVSAMIRAAGEVISDDEQIRGPGLAGVLSAGDRELADVTQLQAAAHHLSRCMFIGPFRNALSLEPSGRYYDIHVGTGLVESWHHLKNSPDPAGNAAAHRVADDIRRIFSLDSLDINASVDGKTLVIYRDGVAHTLDELGSGLAQFIVTLANTAMHRPSYVLVDEPELNLHPSLQIDFLTTLASYASEGVLFATHNIGLARAAADSIYSVRQDEQGISTIRAFEEESKLPELLGELSYSGYRDLGFHTVLLVEGQSEVRTIQQFLRKLGKDHRVVILPLGGAALIASEREHELAELTRLADRIVAVIDSERDVEGGPLQKNREAFQLTCSGLDIACHVLERRALENYFSEAAVQAVKGPKYRALARYERRGDAEQSWSKAENWRIAREMCWEDLDDTDLAAILSRI